MKKLTPIEGAILCLQEMASGGAKSEELRKDVFHTIIGNTEIDTCKAFDTGEWETGISQYNDKWIIVKQYKSRLEAEKGHEGWVKTLTRNPNKKLTDINLWNL